MRSRNKKIFFVVIFLVIVVLLIPIVNYSFIQSRNLQKEDIINNVDSIESNGDLPVFIQFYDWFNENVWNEDEFVDKLDWKAIGIDDDDRSSEEFYYKQFKYIKEMGVDAISWEYHPRLGIEPTYPSENAINALRKSGLKIAPFFDYEIAIKAKEQDMDNMIATLSSSGNIKPNDETIDFITDNLKKFYDKVPKDLLAVDKKGRAVIFVFGYDFDDSDYNPNMWSEFADKLVANIKQYTVSEPAFYWTCKNSAFEEHLYLYHRNNFVPFQFVLDTPQSQFGHDSVTWNFGFDNLGVQKRDNLQRVIRLDQRYIQEMGWLAGNTDPSLVYIYSWNEPFEGSILMPTEQWGDTKARLAKEYINRLNLKEDRQLKKTLLIVDDMQQLWTERKEDWHLNIEREMLLYSMRRFLPQSDVRVNTEVNEELLDRYDSIVDISTEKNEELNKLLLRKMSDKQIMVFDPMAGYRGGGISSYFAQVGENINLNANVELTDMSKVIFARDDIVDITPLESSKVIMSAKINNNDIPIIMMKDDDILINCYNTEEVVLSKAFEEFYNQPMNISIMYGEGFSSQRLEIDANTKEVTENTLNRYSINGRWDIPKDINWYNMPEDVDEKYYNFLFGIGN